MGRNVKRDSGNQREQEFPQVPTQLQLPLRRELAEQHRSLKECVAARVYQQRGGVTHVAGRLDMQPSHLCEVLGGGGDRGRKFDLDELEAYIKAFGDTTPILYLIAKYMPSLEHGQQLLLARINQLQDQMADIAGDLVESSRR